MVKHGGQQDRRNGATKEASTHPRLRGPMTAQGKTNERLPHGEEENKGPKQARLRAHGRRVALLRRDGGRTKRLAICRDSPPRLSWGGVGYPVTTAATSGQGGCRSRGDSRRSK
ncbi:hypothetical protein NL676_007358 [Syzygium grande]|nr:hypothetical protein NL676_007358 [Syzygium grande]